MRALPKWVLANPFPAIHDFESLTVLEQTARIYGAMNTLIEEYNKFADTVNDQLSTFTESEKDSREEFETNITKVIMEFRCSMEQYLKLNLTDTAQTLLNEAIKAGSITVIESYDEANESLNMILGGEV